MKRHFLNWSLRLLVTGGLFYLLFTRLVDPRTVLAELSALSTWWLAAALVMQAGAIYASIWRWNLLLHGQDLRVPHGHLVGTYLIGRFLGTFLPGTIGLDAYRTFDVARRSGATTQSLAVLIVEKIIGFFALSTLVLVTLPGGLRFLPASAITSIFLIFCVPVTVSFVLLLKPGLVMRLLALPFPLKKQWEGRLRQAAQAVTVYRSKTRLLIGAIMCGLLVHISTMLMYFCTAQAIGAPVTLADILFAGPLMIVATVGLPSVGGEGVRELTLIGLLSRVGVPEASAFLVGNLGFWVGLSLSLIGGVIYLIRPASYRPDIRLLRGAALHSAAERKARVSPALPLNLAEPRD